MDGPVTPPISLDPVDVARLIAGIFLNPTLASIIGPYSMIFLAAVGGAAAKLSNKPASGRLAAFRFMAIATLMSVLFTVPAANLVARWSEDWNAQLFFLPAAVLLGYAGDKWKQLLVFVIDLGKVWAKNWVNKGDPK